MASPTALVVGAGLGGMASAIRLRRAGWKVTVLEKNTRVGGKLDRHAAEGFLWDVGPTAVTLTPVLTELFEHAGQRLEDYLELTPVDPICRSFFPDGKVLNTWSKAHLFQIEIARREQDQGQALEGFLRYARRLHDLGGEAWLYHPPRTPFGFLRGNFLKRLRGLPALLSRRTLADVVERRFKNLQVRQVFERYAAYTGSSPFLAPSLLNLIPYIEIQGGSWHLRGGVFRLVEALEKCARELGVEFMFDAEVTSILTERRGRFGAPRARGALVNTRIRMEADAVVCNTDPAHAWTRLLQGLPGASRAFRRLAKRPFSLAPFLILWGVKHRDPRLAHHNVFFSSDLRAESHELVARRRAAQEPTLYVGVSSRTDPTQAPPGQDNYFVMAHVPPLEPDHHWDRDRDAYRDLILARLEKMGLDALRRNIVCEKIITPADFAARVHAFRGAIHGSAFHSFGSVWRRPRARCPGVRGLYFVGGCVRPGGGIPFVLLSAQQTVGAILDDAR
ncbi:MAG: phytoene desaturase [Verrucomicrobiae bacterium]|nr:phytoene desaturase [Verrucomicrobiae bacterium]